MQRKEQFKKLQYDMRQTDFDIPHGRLTLGADDIDAHLGGGLACGRVHLINGPALAGSATGFILAILNRQLARYPDRPVVWCGGASDRSGHVFGQIFGQGLLAMGLDPARFIFVREGHPMRAVAAMEEALSQPKLSAVICEYGLLSEKSDMWMKTSRRLQLAAETGGAIGLMLGRHASASGFETAWQIDPAISQSEDPDMWDPCWQAQLRYMRGGAPWHGRLGFALQTGCFTQPQKSPAPRQAPYPPALTGPNFGPAYGSNALRPDKVKEVSHVA